MARKKTYAELMAEAALAGTSTSDLAALLAGQGTQLPDAGLGPVTNTTRAGRPNPMLTASQDAPRPNDYMAPVAELLSIPMGAYGAGQLVGSGINAAREGDYASGAGQVALGMAGMLPMAPKGGKFKFSEKGLHTEKIGPAEVTYGVNPSTKHAELTLLRVPEAERGKGAARNALNEFVNEADALGYMLTLNADPLGKGGLSKAALDKFYKSAGFVKNKGKNKDFTTQAEYIRRPQEIAQALEAHQPQGIHAFHGSPHDFDRFSMDAIGTGEGAQAYGHGLYFAESEGVAKSYKDALGGKSLGPNPTGAQRYLVDGAPLDLNKPEHLAAATARKFDTPDEAAKFLRSDYWSRWESPEAPTDMPGFAAEKAAAKDLSERAAQIIEGGKLPEMKTPGHMYEVRINADPNDFLDWDKPLSQQSEKVRTALEAQGFKSDRDAIKAFDDALYAALMDDSPSAPLPRQPSDPLGSDIVRKMHAQRGSQWIDPNKAGEANASKALREAGIPGIRYLDQMSRGAGEGSSNYVVFDDAIIDIVKKYGIAGLALLQAAGYGTNEGEETQ